MSKYFRSPILLFLFLGIVAWLVYMLLRPAPNETIIVSSQTIDALVRQQEELSQYPLDQDEIDLLIESYIEDEILINEAFKRGLVKNDYRIRKRITSMMRSSLTDNYPEPSQIQLMQFYEANSDKYLSDTSISFWSVFYSFSSEEIPDDTVGFIMQLKNSKDPLSYGEYSTFGSKFTRYTFRQGAMLLGRPFMEKIFDAELNSWYGPVSSKQGIHYILPKEMHLPELPPFEQMEEYLRQDYLLQKMRESQQLKIDEMRKDYKIIIEEEDSE